MARAMMTMINEIMSMSPIMTMSISMILLWILRMNLFMIMMLFCSRSWL